VARADAAMTPRGGRTRARACWSTTSIIAACRCRRARGDFR
jgi:hypothetical protein